MDTAVVSVLASSTTAIFSVIFSSVRSTKVQREERHHKWRADAYLEALSIAQRSTMIHEAYSHNLGLSDWESDFRKSAPPSADPIEFARARALLAAYASNGAMVAYLRWEKKFEAMVVAQQALAWNARENHSGDPDEPLEVSEEDVERCKKALVEERKALADLGNAVSRDLGTRSRWNFIGRTREPRDPTDPA